MKGKGKEEEGKTFRKRIIRKTRRKFIKMAKKEGEDRSVCAGEEVVM